MIATREQIGAALQDLGAKGSADNIAEYFRSIGVVGEQQNNRRCPVANYLQAVLSDPGVSVREVFTIQECGEYAGRWVASSTPHKNACELPPEVRSFVIGFDNDQFPYLGEPMRMVASW